jgi:hypothetical protein
MLDGYGGTLTCPCPCPCLVYLPVQVDCCHCGFVVIFERRVEQGEPSLEDCLGGVVWCGVKEAKEGKQRKGRKTRTVQYVDAEKGTG